MGYDLDDSFPFDLGPNGIPFGPRSKGKLSPRSYPMQYERNWKYSFLSACIIFPCHNMPSLSSGAYNLNKDGDKLQPLRQNMGLTRAGAEYVLCQICSTFYELKYISTFLEIYFQKFNIFFVPNMQDFFYSQKYISAFFQI